MGDEGDYWRDVKPLMKEESQRRRKRNREGSADLLKQNGVQFESKNGGAHLIVEGTKSTIDFWPGTGKFITRDGKRGRGVKNLLKFCK